MKTIGRCESRRRVDALRVPRNDLELHECITVCTDLLHDNRLRTVLDRLLDVISQAYLLLAFDEKSGCAAHLTCILLPSTRDVNSTINVLAMGWMVVIFCMSSTRRLANGFDVQRPSTSSVLA